MPVCVYSHLFVMSPDCLRGNWLNPSFVRVARRRMKLPFV